MPHRIDKNKKVQNWLHHASYNTSWKIKPSIKIYQRSSREKVTINLVGKVSWHCIED